MCNAANDVVAWVLEYDGDRSYLCNFCARDKGIDHATILNEDERNELIETLEVLDVVPIYCWATDETDYERFCDGCKDDLELPLTDVGRVERQKRFCVPAVNKLRDDRGQLPAYTWIGGYPMFYLDHDNAVICPKCANELEWNDAKLVAGDVHWEGQPLVCENCNDEIESAYGDPEEDEERTAHFDRFSLTMTKSQAESASHQGQCDEGVAVLTSQLWQQLDDVDPLAIQAELKEYGAWSEEELTDEAQNRRRIVWIAAGNIREEND